MWQDLRFYEATVKSFHLILNEIEGLLRVLSRGVCVLVTQSCPTLCNPKNCSPPGSSVHGILQARMLEWVAIPFSRGSSRPMDQTQVSCITGRFFTIGAIGEAHYLYIYLCVLIMYVRLHID